MIGTCPHCGKSLRTTSPESEDEKLPQARSLRLIYVGKQVYSIDGNPGLWCIGGCYTSPTRVKAMSSLHRPLYYERLTALEYSLKEYVLKEVITPKTMTKEV